MDEPELAGRGTAANAIRVSGKRSGTAIRAGLTVSAILLLARWTRYLEAEMLGLSQVVGPGSVCVDVGAAAGLYTLALSRLAGPDGEVHSIEPLSFAHPVWRRVLRAAEGRNVRRHQLALGPEPGEALMSVPIGRFGPVTGRSFLAMRNSGLGSNAEFAGQMAVPVQVDTLDALCARTGLTQLDFVKIDVEGAELGVLEGGEKTIESLAPTLLIEIEARHAERFRCAPEDIVGWLRSRGYTMHAWQHGWRETAVVRPAIRNYLFRPAAGRGGAGPAAGRPERAPRAPRAPGALGASD